MFVTGTTDFIVREYDREIKASSIKIVNKYPDRDFNCIVLTRYRLVCDYSIANVNSFNSSIDCNYKIVDYIVKEIKNHIMKVSKKFIVKVIKDYIVRKIKCFVVR